MKKSKWFWWSFLPFFNFAAWIHAAIRTGRNSYYWIAAIYGLPFSLAILLGPTEEVLKLPKETVDRLTDMAGAAATVLWIVGMIHALLKKDLVDQHIQAHDNGEIRPGQPAVQNEGNQRQKAAVLSNANPPNTQRVAIQSAFVSGSCPTTSSEQNLSKTFKYVDAHGNIVGPTTIASLRALQQAGVVSDNTRIIDEAAGRSFTAQQLLEEEKRRNPEAGPDGPQCGLGT